MFPKNKFEISGSAILKGKKHFPHNQQATINVACNVISATNLPDFFSHSKLLVHLDIQKRKCLSLCRNIEISLFLGHPPIFGGWES